MTLHAKLDSIFDRYARSDAPGCTVAIARDGETIYRRAAGMANVEHGVANRPGTRMPIASVSKHFTCACVLLLADERKLALDDPIGRWVPELHEIQRNATLRQLMTHTSGIQCYLDQFPYSGINTIPTGMPLTIQAKLGEVNFLPGHDFTYNNGGYLLLTLAIERASGMRFGEFLATRLFHPLRMDATSLAASRPIIEPGVATRYLPAAGGSEVGWRHDIDLTQDMAGDGGIVSSVDDMLRWATYLRTSSGPVSLEKLAVTTALTNGFVSHYGFGLRRKHWRGVDVVDHTGGLFGATSQFLVLPQEGIDIVVMFNRGASVSEITTHVLEVLLEGRLTAGVPAPRTEGHTALLGQYLADETGMLLSFVDMDGKLGLGVFGAPPTPLAGRDAQAGELPFEVRMPGEVIFRAPTGAGASPVPYVEYSDSGRWRRADRLAGPVPTTASVAAITHGTYVNDEIGSELCITAKDDQLSISVRGKYGSGTLLAEPVAPDVLRVWFEEIPVGFIARLERSNSGSGQARAVIFSTHATRRTAFVRRGDGGREH